MHRPDQMKVFHLCINNDTDLASALYISPGGTPTTSALLSSITSASNPSAGQLQKGSHSQSSRRASMTQPNLPLHPLTS